MSFVNTWECDENDHWNVQFYIRAFEQAGAVFAFKNHIATPTAETLPRYRHVRFLRELRSAEAIRIRSAIIGDGAHRGSVVHVMENSSTSEVCATCIDSPSAKATHMAGIHGADVQYALPRGLDVGPHQPSESNGLLESGHATLSYVGIVRPFETDDKGELLDHAIVSRFSDSASHVWSFAGISNQWLESRNYGRVTVEMKVTRLANVRAGDCVRMISWITERSEKTMAVTHQIEDLRTGIPVACGAIRCLILDLSTRRAVRFPATFDG